MSEPISKIIAVVGAGYWGKNLIRDFNSINVLHTICDNNTDLLNTYKDIYPNINLVNDYELILKNKDITAVCISSPSEVHYILAKQALLHNKDVYVEKPITLNVQEAEELIEMAVTNNKILMVGHILHYHPAIQKIKELIQNNEIGKIKHIISNRLNLGKFRVNENVLWSFAPHDISVILSLCNNDLPDRVICTGKSFITKDVHDVTNTMLYYDKEDVYININVSWLNPYKEQKMSIIGDKGMIVFDDTLPTNKILLFRDYLEWTNTVPMYPISVKTNGEIISYDNESSPLVNECKHFIECCKTRNKPLTDGNEGLRVLKVLHASHQSLMNKGLIQNIKVQNITNIKEVDYYAHDSSIIDNDVIIGHNTKIWHFSHICKGAIIGNNCNIGQNVYIAGILGDNCKVQNNVSVYKGVVCEEGVFLGPSCVLTNDINPRAEYSKGGQYIQTLIKKGATIGANATIICGNTIGEYALIGAGAVITKDVPPYSIVIGNPGRIIGTIDQEGNRTLF